MSRLVIHKSTDNITIKTKNYTNVLFYYTKMSEQKNTTFYSVSLPTLKHLYRKKNVAIAQFFVSWPLNILTVKIQEIDKGDIFVRLLTSKKFRLLRHAIAVGLLFIAIVLPTSTAPEFAAPYERIGRIIIYIAIVSFFYANMYYLIPKYMFRGKSILYIVWLTVILLMGFFIVKTLFVTIIEPHRIIPKKE